MPLSPTLQFHPEAYTTRGPKLMGRHAAGESFLRGLLAYGRNAGPRALVESGADGQAFIDAVAAAGRDPSAARVIGPARLAELAESGLLFVPGPVIGEQAWRRARFGDAAWSLCGVTHTLSSHLAMDAVTELLSAPVQPWDALVCTSTAARQVVHALLERQAAYLRERLGGRRFILPQFPVIPLGIHAGDFAFTESQRAVARHRLGADENTVVVLFAGRLSFHAKAHPWAMYAALERAAGTLPSGRKVILVEFGQHANEPIAAAFAEAAAFGCPSVTVRHLDGKAEGNRETAWAAADVFCSLSDNIQETFGLTPLEAMAAGLPVVVSDWDGYRDTIRDGIDGFRVPTVMPRPGSGGDLSERHALGIDSYDMYCGHASTLVAVDIETAAAAFARLFASADLRRRMGEAGRQHVADAFDWSAIIPRYEALWAQLDELRRRELPRRPPSALARPARPDPFRLFAGHASVRLQPETLLALVGTDAAEARRRAEACRRLAMFRYAAAVLPDEAEVAAILTRAAGGPSSARELIGGVAAVRQPFAFRALGWLLKIGVLRVAGPVRTAA